MFIWKIRVTLMWFLPSVCPHMFYKTTIIWEKFYHLKYTDLAFLQCVSSYEMFSYIFFEKSLSHWVHLYGSSPVCVKRWIFSLNFCVKAFSQWSHRNDFFRVCTFRCFYNSIFNEIAILCWNLVAISTFLWLLPVTPHKKELSKHIHW